VRALTLLVFSFSALAQPVRWTSMIWQPQGGAAQTVEHGALLLELHLDGATNPAYMQLDTGCDADLVYRLPYEELAPRAIRLGRDRIAVSGTAAGLRFASEPFHIRREAGFSWAARFLAAAGLHWNALKGKPVLVGTIGTPFLENRILLLDFVAQRLALLEVGAELPPAIGRLTDFVTLGYRNRKIFVPIAIAGAKYDIFFDTGASAFPLTTSRLHWRDWTGAAPADPRHRVFKTWSWDHYTTSEGAPIKSSLCLGRACFPSPFAYFETAAAPGFDFASVQADGLIGNALFEGRYTVVLDLPHQRFGLFSGSLAYSDPR
jgi:hypothetical protein